LHWHATAAEWAFVLEGRVRTTVMDPQGNSEINDFDPGDVWYFPRGHPHALSCLGDQPCRFILIFDNGYFSEFGTFSLTDWLGHTLPANLAKNFGLPAASFDGIPQKEQYFVRGPVPPEKATTLRGTSKAPPETHRYRLLAQPPYSTYQYGREWRVDADRFPISTTFTGVVLDLEPGGFRELHWHPTADEWQYVIDGQFHVSMFGSNGRYRFETLAKGDVGYSIENIGNTLGRLLIGFNTGHYQAVDLSLWMASNPAYLLADHFGKPAALFERFPKEQVFIGPPARQE
jgi:oxalate decarboxylase